MSSSEAIVVKNAGSHFLLSRLPEWDPFPAVLRGKVRLSRSDATNPVAVGDRVRFSTGADGATVIDEVLPRKNYIIRKSANLSRQSHIIAANLDRAVIAVSLFCPEIKLPFLDRLLLTCRVYGVEPVLVLNKMDIYGEEGAGAVNDFERIYSGADCRIIETSCKTGEGIEELRALCGVGVSLFAGESGVGKSSLIKALDPSLSPKTGKISLANMQGRHTTSLYEMYPLNLQEALRGGGFPKGFIIDSPGLRGFGLVNLQKEEIPLYFPEMLRAGKNCRFTPCTHTHEPGCAVKAAVEAGEISPERYNSYLGMLEEDSKFRH